MGNAPTVYDVATQAGVSIATVSRVLRGPDAVRPATRDRVLAAVRELGYVPSGSARGLAERRTGVLGLYFPGFDAMDEVPDVEFSGDGGYTIVRDEGHAVEGRPLNLYFDEVLRGAELEAWRRGFALMVGVGRGDVAEETVRDMAGRVDGLVLLANSVPDEVLAQLARRVPLVVLAGPPRGDSYDHVTVSNTEAMAALTDHVLGALDGRIPAYVSGPADSPDDAQRWAGFREAIERSGHDITDVSVLRGDFTRRSGREIAAGLVGELPAALVCGNDQMALGALDAFAAAGVDVPGDVLVTGFDGIEAGELSSPRLTTIRQPMDQLGRAAIQVLDRRLAEPSAGPLSVRLPVEVVLRGSSLR